MSVVEKEQTKDFIRQLLVWLETEDGQEEARRWSKVVKDEVGLAKVLMQSLAKTGRSADGPSD